MNIDPQTPEELEMLFEDSLLLHDPESLLALFADGAVLVIDEEGTARGAALALLALATWHGTHPYVANPQRVIQVSNTALIISRQGINVAERNRNGSWQYVIVCQLETIPR